MSSGYFYCFDKGEYLRDRRQDAGDQGCLLCRIAAGDPGVADLTVHRDALFAVSLNLYPYNPGHLLVFPVRHVEDLRALTAEEAARRDRLVNYFLDILENVFHPAGFNIGYNMGRAAGASQPHLHEHIIPRYPHEIGLADLVAGKRVLVEDPRRSRERLQQAVYERPFSMSMT